MGHGIRNYRNNRTTKEGDHPWNAGFEGHTLVMEDRNRAKMMVQYCVSVKSYIMHNSIFWGENHSGKGR